MKFGAESSSKLSATDASPGCRVRPRQREPCVAPGLRPAGPGSTRPPRWTPPLPRSEASVEVSRAHSCQAVPAATAAAPPWHPRHLDKPLGCFSMLLNAFHVRPRASWRPLAGGEKRGAFAYSQRACACRVMSGLSAPHMDAKGRQRVQHLHCRHAIGRHRPCLRLRVGRLQHHIRPLSLLFPSLIGSPTLCGPSPGPGPCVGVTPPASDGLSWSFKVSQAFRRRSWLNLSTKKATKRPMGRRQMLPWHRKA